MYEQHVGFNGDGKTCAGNSAMNNTVPPPKTAEELFDDAMKRKQKTEKIAGLNVPVLDERDKK